MRRALGCRGLRNEISEFLFKCLLVKHIPSTKRPEEKNTPFNFFFRQLQTEYNTFSIIRSLVSRLKMLLVVFFLFCFAVNCNRNICRCNHKTAVHIQTSSQPCSMFISIRFSGIHFHSFYEKRKKKNKISLKIMYRAPVTTAVVAVVTAAIFYQ